MFPKMRKTAQILLKSDQSARNVKKCSKFEKVLKTCPAAQS